MTDILIFGAGGHAKVVADIFLQQNGFNIRAFVDDRLAGGTLLSVEVIRESAAWMLTNCHAVVAIGDNSIRSKVVSKITQQMPSMKFATAIHPTASIAKEVSIDNGTVVMANVSVNSSTKIGAHCILNTASSIDHDCQMADFSSVAPGAVLGGSCVVGTFSAISIGAVLIHGMKVGEHTVVGAGALVVRSLPDSVVAYGSPARVIRARVSGDRYL